MNGFKKLLLTSAILAASSNAMALQAMDDESLSSTTGQDGITLNISNSTIVDMDVTWVDRDGFGAFNDAGALVINNVDLTINDLDIVVDAGSNTTDGAQLNIGISTTQDVVIGLDNTTIEVASAGATGSAVAGNTEIITFNAGSSLTITGGINANVKLGNRAVGEDFMTLSNSTPFTITLTGMTILDAEATATNGVNNVGIGIGTLSIANVVLNNAINVVDGGLTINTAGTTIGEIGMENIVLGDQVTAVSLGDVYLNGLTANTTLTISGH